MLDLTFIREMMGNNEAVVNRFLTIFKSQCPQQMQELKLHYVNKDWTALSNVAHSMKTQFKYLSLEPLADQVYEIETWAEQESITHLEERILALEKTLNDLFKNID